VLCPVRKPITTLNCVLLKDKSDIANDYGLDGRGIESRWGRDFPHLSRPALGPTQPPVRWVTGSFLGVKCGRGVTLTTHLLLTPSSWKSRAIPLPSSGPQPALYRSYFTLLVKDKNLVFADGRTYLLTPWSRVLLEKLTSKLCS